jgi:hypothetical protein
MQNKNSIDAIILGTVILLAALPFAQVFIINLAGIMLTAFELLYLVLIMLILFRVLMDGRIKKTCIPFLLFAATVVLYFFISISIYARQPLDVINQLREYLPFFIGTILLAVGTTATAEKYLRLLVIAAIFSSATALIIHHFMPGVLAKMLPPSSEVVTLATVHGRLYWTNSGLVFFVILMAMLPKREFPVNKVIIGIALLFTVAGLFNTVNRTMVIALILFLTGYVLGEKRVAPFIRRSKKAIALGITAVLIIFGLMSAFPKMNFLIKNRYLGSGYGFSHLFETAVTEERIPIYAQYEKSIKKYFPVGQGLGEPLHIRWDGRGVYTSDISLISFLLPFGLIGLILFVVFIYSLFRLISKAKTHYHDGVIRVLRSFLIISVIASLNIDLFSRNNFVIFSSMLVLALQNGKDAPADKIR